MKIKMFLGEFLKNSGQTGSIIPSSRFLIRKMLPDSLPWNSLQQIAELGPGTGVFTQYLQQKKHPDSRLYLFEKNENFRQFLRQRFPELPVFDEALQLGSVVQETGRPFDLIVSGLPFANFPDELREKLFRAIHDALADDGTFVAFQYTPLLLKKFKNHFLLTDIGYTLLNIPPAWVFRCAKQQATSSSRRQTHS
jgi:phospholipid N-methyltransferase